MEAPALPQLYILLSSSKVPEMECFYCQRDSAFYGGDIDTPPQAKCLRKKDKSSFTDDNQ